MRESFYIDLERREAAKRAWEEDKTLDMDGEFACKGEDTGFEPPNFPMRECRPIIRRRSREQVRKMINR